MNTRILKYLATTAAIVAMPVLAKAQTVAYDTSSYWSPVRITAISVNGQYAPWAIGGHASAAGLFGTNLDAGHVAVKFVNESNVPATSVKFSVANGRNMHTIVDKGTFSPGAQIEHNFAVGGGLNQLANTTAKVAEVEFADGSAWRNLDDAALHVEADKADATAKRQAAHEQANADARRVVFRHLGTSQ
jgi:hypothetical protein